MAEYISFQPSDFFNTVLWTGNATARSITGVGFQPDMTWVKARSIAENHALWDAARGAGSNKAIASNGTQTESSLNSANYGYVGAFESDGFTLAAGTGGGNAWDFINMDTKTYAAWNWKAGTTSGLTGGTITPSAYSFNTTSGFGVYAYTGTGANATIPHGLGVTPSVMMIKNVEDTQAWAVYHIDVGNTKRLTLNDTSVEATSAVTWNDTSPTSTVFSIGTNSRVNTSGEDYIAYVWAPVKGYSKIGSYTGSGNADGPFAYTGFRPAFILTKPSNNADTNNWSIYDFKRIGYNVDNESLFPDTSDSETTTDDLDILSNGFKINTTSSRVNGNNTNYVYMAFAEFPIVSSNDVPTVAR